MKASLPLVNQRFSGRELTPEMYDFAGSKTELLQLIHLKLLQVSHTDSFAPSICIAKDADVISSFFLQLPLASPDQLNSLVFISPQLRSRATQNPSA